MRIAVIYPPPFLDSTPCLHNLVQALADAGHEMEVYTRAEEKFTRPAFEGSVGVHFFEGSQRSFPAWLKSRAGAGLRDLGAVIAMDRWGMLAAARLLRLRRAIPLVYFNVELYRPPIFTGWKHRVMNSLEAWLVRRHARLTLTPSRERGVALSAWYGLDARATLTIPNSPRGAARPEKGGYLAQKHGIEPGRPILLYFGSLTSANRIEELMESARSRWPEELVLVLHGRQRMDADGRRWFEERTRGSRCRIVLSPDPVGLTELDALVRSADLGIALYPTEGEGFQTMGTSSGKIAQYLFSGVPVITSKVGSLEGIFARHPDAGAAIGHADEIPAVARRLLESPANARQSAAACFDAEFSFDKHFGIFLRRFDEVALKGRT